ncbi:MAG: hypothetical protein VB112_02650 [Oscillospiraceae bacterium]|nr:hypothetical protein [Oscillospiraceae bacterium]
MKLHENTLLLYEYSVGYPLYNGKAFVATDAGAVTTIFVSERAVKSFHIAQYKRPAIYV